ncbi:hypothetical protein ACFO3J_24000 [Streptomyces polygonati]|uniref:Uncharacterized protein n=1 Tax=Streptomyces polygonati TaxID=1617087 RepID=A0ABV8HR58_9ACTN
MATGRPSPVRGQTAATPLKPLDSGHRAPAERQEQDEALVQLVGDHGVEDRP